MSSEPRNGSGGFDPFSPELRRNPYPAYRDLRDNHPVMLMEQVGWYAISRNADVDRVLRSPDTFSSSVMRSADSALMGRDPPEHTVVRKIVTRAFDVSRTAGFEHLVKATARPLVQQFARAGGGDIVRGIAVELPVRIIAQLLGISEDRLPEFKEWSEAVVLTASGMTPPGQQQAMAERIRAFDWFFGELIETRRAHPGDDVLSALMRGQETGLLDADNLRSLAKLLLIAGNETTTNLISNAIAVLMEQPGLQERLRKEPDLCGAWVNETLRFDAPVQLLLRQARRDVEIAGFRIPDGGVIAAVLGSANRDERSHPAPDVFRLDRAERHLAFGTGPHFCVGASLARLEATVVLSMLLEETQVISALESVDDAPRIPALQLRGPQRLLVGVG